jgi:hypothetical protein
VRIIPDIGGLFQVTTLSSEILILSLTFSVSIMI